MVDYFLKLADNPFMKIKRLIAREGLVILGCIAITLMIFLSVNLFPKTELPHVYSISSGGHTRHLSLEEYQGYFTDSDKSEIFDNLVNKFPDEFSKPDSEISKFASYPSDFEIKYQGDKSLRFIIGNIASYSFLIYPIYLLIRFIIWAVRTLKSKN